MYLESRDQAHCACSHSLPKFQHSSLPLALAPSPDLEPDLIVTGAEAIKKTTVKYFQHLYHCSERPPQQKPWITTPSVLKVKEATSLLPFKWPVLLSLNDL